MSTAVTIHSLSRIDEDRQKAKFPSPFDFQIKSNVTGKWNFERRPFSRTALTKVTDAFFARVCRVFVPKEFMAEQQSVLHLQIETDPKESAINRTIGPHIKDRNVYGTSGIIGPLCMCCNDVHKCCDCNDGNFQLECLECGVTTPKTCIKGPEDLASYNETWPLYPADKCETNTHWIYESCGTMSLNQDWRAKTLRIRLRDACGYVLIPEGFTKEQLCAFDECKVNPLYMPLFQKDNQLMIVLRFDYMDHLNDAVGLEQCF